MTIFMIIIGYLVIGIGFSLYFLFRRIGIIDPAALKAGWKFKLIIFPGCVLMWPFLIHKRAVK